MQLDISAEVILSQLGYSVSDSSLRQAEKMIEVTTNFDKFAKHILTLNDHLKKINAYVTLSNTTPYLKIKCDENESKEALETFHEEVLHWADKYNVKLEKLPKKEVYYILGTND